TAGARRVRATIALWEIQDAIASDDRSVVARPSIRVLGWIDLRSCQDWWRPSREAVRTANGSIRCCTAERSLPVARCARRCVRYDREATGDGCSLCAGGRRGSGYDGWLGNSEAAPRSE